MEISKSQGAVLKTFERDGLSSRAKIKKVLPRYGITVAALLRREWIIDSSKDHGAGRFALTKDGSIALRQILGREPLYNQE